MLIRENIGISIHFSMFGKLGAPFIPAGTPWISKLDLSNFSHSRGRVIDGYDPEKQ